MEVHNYRDEHLKTAEIIFKGSNIITRQESFTLEIENLKFDIVPAIFVTEDSVKIHAPGIRELK
ncbi:MAG: hypothetical protein M3Q58_09845 [Bacteroidota bacterium]|nr:hypothetical protein [Bacteroidota bacterium]